jgi:hypothetical protein
MKIRDKYLVENKEDAARVLYNSLLSHIKNIERFLKMKWDL